MRTSMQYRTNRGWRIRAKHLAVVLLLALSIAATAPQGRAQVNVLTQHNDNSRTGANLSETTLTTSNVNSTQFGKIFAMNVDGNVYAQPLYAAGVAIPGQGTHNVLYVATMHDSVYAFDADTGAQLWTVNKGPSIPNTELLAGDMNCTQGNGIYPDMGNEVGITSTPVIDLATNTLYCFSRSHAGGVFTQTLHALDITTGAEKFGGPVNIPSTVTAQSGVRTFDLARQNQRSALALAGGNLYICWASHGDCTPYNGYIMKFNASTLALQAVFCTSPTQANGLDGIWMAGQGPVIDVSGNVYVATGNGYNSANTGGPDYACSILKFNSSLTLTDWFMPFNVANLCANDLDLASAGPMLMPGANQIVVGGKESKIYLINPANLGHFTSGSDNVIQSFPAGLGHIHGSPVYWNSPVNGSTVYVWSEQDHLRAFKYTGGLFQTTPISVGSTTLGMGMPGAFLSVSANGSTAGTGILWATHPFSLDANHALVPGILRAYDASNVGTELYNSYQSKTRDDFGNVAKYTPPTIANGKVYVATFSRQIAVYGLLGAGVPGAPTNVSAIAGNTQIGLTWGTAFTATSYNVKRATVSGGPYTTIATGVAVNNYTNTGLTNGVTYYFVISGVNSHGEGANSAQVSAAPIVAAAAIDAGGPAASPYVADVDFSGGTTATNWTGAIDTTAVADPAPQGVYQSERYGAMTYTVSGLSVGAAYTVRLHFCENLFTASGLRKFSAAINGTSVLSNFDILAAAGVLHKANVQQFSTTANGSGQIVIAFTNNLNNALINGIEIIPGGPAAPPVPTGLTATAGNAQVTLSWNASSGATSYNVKRSTVSGSGYVIISSPATTSYTNTGLTNGTMYYYVVSAVNSVGESGNSAQASAMPTAGAGSLTGSVAASATTANLTTLGTADWGHWGLGGVPGWDHKSSGGTQISTYTPVGSPTIASNSAMPTTYSWSDGTPTGGSAGNTFGDTFSGANNGFSITAPADKTQRTLKVFVGGYLGRGTLTAHLSDSSAADYVDASQGNPTGGYNVTYTLTYKAASAAKTLTVTWKTTTDNSGNGTCNVSLQAAYLTVGASPPPTPTGLSATAGNTQVALSWNASSGATSYNVKRSTVSGSGYVTISSPTTTGYTNTGLTNGTTYYYVVSAVNASGESANSAQVSATPTGGSGNTHGGTWACKGVFTTTAGFTNLAETVNVASNQTYVGSLWIKGGGAVKMKVLAGNWGAELVAVQCNATSTWQQYTTPNISTGANTQLTYVLQDSYGIAGTAYIDDTFLGISGGSNMLANPGFESGNTAWAFSPAPVFSIVQNP